MRLGLGLGIPYSLGGPKAAAFSPLDLSPVLWLDASDTSTITEVGGAVSQWDDKSGNGYDVTQGTAANQPTSGTRTINGLNVLDFDGLSEYMAVTFGATFTQPNTIFTVFQDDDPSTAYYVHDGVGVSNRNTFLIGPTFGTNRYQLFAGTTRTGGIADTSAHISRALFNGASSSLFIDGSSVIAADPGAQSLTGLTIGARYDATQSLDGIIAEIIVVDGTLTAGEIADTESYLANKWGITI